MEHQVKIFLAEDDRDDSFLFQEALARLPYSTSLHLAQDGELLLDLLHNQSIPDFIFLDLNMPLMSGQECLKKLMAHEVCQNVPVIIYSTASKKDIIDECYALGASLYVVKPNDTIKLRDTILEIIKTFIKRKAIAP